jgi:cytochrome P450
MTTSPAKIPLVPGLPFFGNAFQFASGPLRFMQGSSQKYGRVFRLRMPPGREIIASSDPEWFTHVLVNNHKNYIKDFAYKQLGLALGNGLLVNDGESWYRQRRLAQPAFYKKRLEDLFHVMETVADKYLEQLEEADGQDVRIDDHMMQLTSDVVIETLLGGAFKDEFRFIQSQILTLQEHIVNRIRMPLYIPFSIITGKDRAFKQMLHALDEKIYHIIRERKKQAEGNDLMSMLMAARDEDTGEAMSDKQLRDELVTIYVAGHETSGYCLSWTLYLLTQHPDKLAKLREEVDKVFSTYEGKLGGEGLRSLQYTKQVVEESLRLYPTAHIVGREALAADHVGPYLIPKGGLILLLIYSVHRDPRYWEEPESFIPERFAPELEKTRPKNVFLPFGAGPRMCIGNNFAMMEIIMVLAMMVHRFDFSLVPGQTIEPQPMITLRPKNGIRLKLKSRQTVAV